VTVPASPPPVSNRSNEVRDMYAALLQGELSGEAALAASEQMLTILMDSMTNAVFWKDLNSQYLGCNRSFSEFAGFEPALLLGKSDRDMPWADDEEFSSEWFIDWDRAVMDSGEPQFGILERLRRADGKVTWIETNKVPLRDLNGDIIGLLGTFKDVTDVHLAQEELQRTLGDLDARVQHRTAELERANEALRREVDDRIRSQAEERQQRTYAEALRDTAAAMSQTFDLECVTEQALGGVERLVSNDLAAIVLNSASGTLELRRHLTAFGYDIDVVDGGEVDGATLATLTVIEGLSNESGPVIVDHPARSLGPAGCVLGARMRVADQLVGYLIVESATPGFFTDVHAERLGAVADQAGAVLSNASLAQRVSELAAAEERQRLARDLHDAVNQSLWTAALSAESLLNDVPEDSDLHCRIDRLRQLTRGALSEMRELLLELRPAELAHVELRELIEHLLNALEGRRTIDVTVDLQRVVLEPEVNVALYRIAQQALSNMAQHSNASAVDVRLTAGPPVVLTISDDGDGFDEADVPSGHIGLQIMRERAEAVGAHIDIDGHAASGTTVTVTVTP
jgi:PAS domain S-box-containing protein